MTKLSVLCAALALTVSSVALANQGPHGFEPAWHHGGYTAQGPSGFDNQAPSTIASVLSSAYDEQYVMLKGRLTKYLGRDRYEFTDGTGKIEVELDDDHDWSYLAKDQLIMISGEFDNDFFDKKIEVKYAVPVERAPAPAQVPVAR